MCESFKSLGLLLHTNPEQEQEQQRDPFLGGLRHAKILTVGLIHPLTIVVTKLYFA